MLVIHRRSLPDLTHHRTVIIILRLKFFEKKKLIVKRDPRITDEKSKIELGINVFQKNVYFPHGFVCIVEKQLFRSILKLHSVYYHNC